MTVYRVVNTMTDEVAAQFGKRQRELAYKLADRLRRGDLEEGNLFGHCWMVVEYSRKLSQEALEKRNAMPGGEECD